MLARRLFFRLQRWWARRSPSTKSLPKYLWRAVSNYVHSGTGSRQAAALAYYAIFSAFPLVLLLAVGIGSIVGPAVAQEQIAQGLEFFLPATTVSDIQEIVEGALIQSSSFGLVATAALLWAATGLFTNITNSIDDIFEFPTSRSMWRQRLLAILMGLTLVALVMISFLASGVLRLISALTPGNPSMWVSIGTFFLPFGLDVVIFALLFHYVPTREVNWDAVWPAAIFGSIGWEIAKRGFEWYLGNLANYSIIYGSIATGIVMLFWAWVIASLFLFSAQLCARLNEWMTEQAEHRLLEQEHHRLLALLQDSEQTPLLPPIAETQGFIKESVIQQTVYPTNTNFVDSEKAQ